MNTNFEQIMNIDKIGKRARDEAAKNAANNTMSASAVETINQIAELAEKERFEPAEKDIRRRLLLCIDVQNDFIDGGSLEVTNSAPDVERIGRFIYNNMGGLTKIMCSLDTHQPYQIFHPCWWGNPNGDHPDPYTVITYDDVKANRWQPLYGNIMKSHRYLKELEAGGKKQLCIWPYHCIQGTEGHGLENEFAKMVYFHSIAKKTKNIMVPKGTDPYSEMYGIIKPEFSEKNYINTPVLNAMKEYDEIYVVGEAASHCVMESVKQIAEYYANEPEITQKITVFEDCTSPIAGCEDDTKAAFDDFDRNYGIKIAKSTDISF